VTVATTSGRRTAVCGVAGFLLRERLRRRPLLAAAGAVLTFRPRLVDRERLGVGVLLTGFFFGFATLRPGDLDCCFFLAGVDDFGRPLLLERPLSGLCLAGMVISDYSGR